MNSEYYNTKIKIYPNGKNFITISNRSIFSPLKPEEENTPEYISDSDNETESNKTEKEKEPNIKLNTKRAMLRSKSKIFDIAFCNDWKYFLTITMDDSKLNARDVPTVMQKLIKWLNNKQQRNGLSYIIIPEYHTTGRVHMHGLINDALETVESGTYKVKGVDKPMLLSTIKRRGLFGNIICPVYNVPEWKYGFTTAVPIYGDQSALANYVTKYLTEVTTKIFGKYYWSSKDLLREPEIEYCNTPEYKEIEQQEYTVPKTDIKLKYITELTRII